MGLFEDLEGRILGGRDDERCKGERETQVGSTNPFRRCHAVSQEAWQTGFVAAAKGRRHCNLLLVVGRELDMPL